MDDHAVVQNEEVFVLQAIVSWQPSGFMQSRVGGSKIPVHNTRNAGRFLCGTLNLEINFELRNPRTNHLERSTMSGFTGSHAGLQQLHFVSML